MNLPSLPQEIIARVLCYTDYVTTNEIRKLNFKIDAVAKSYECGTKLPVKQILMCYDPDDDDEISFNCVLDIDEEAVDYDNIPTEDPTLKYIIFRKCEESPLEVLDKFLGRLKLLGPEFGEPPLNGKISFDTGLPFIVDDQILSILHKYRKHLLRGLIRLYVNTDIDCSRAAVRQFFASAKNLRDLWFERPTTGMDAFLRTSLLKNRQWENLRIDIRSWDYKFTHKHLNDRFLRRVVKNCKRCIIEFYNVTCTNFTANGVIEMIKMILEEQLTPESIFIGAAYSEDPTFHSMEEKIRAIPGIQCTFERFEYLTRGDNPRVILADRCQVPHPTIPDTYMFDFHMYN